MLGGDPGSLLLGGGSLCLEFCLSDALRFRPLCGDARCLLLLEREPSPLRLGLHASRLLLRNTRLLRLLCDEALALGLFRGDASLFLGRETLLLGSLGREPSLLGLGCGVDTVAVAVILVIAPAVILVIAPAVVFVIAPAIILIVVTPAIIVRVKVRGVGKV